MTPAFELVDQNIILELQKPLPTLHHAGERSIIPEIAFPLRLLPPTRTGHRHSDGGGDGSYEWFPALPPCQLDLKMQMVADIRKGEDRDAIFLRELADDLPDLAIVLFQRPFASRFRRSEYQMHGRTGGEWSRAPAVTGPSKFPAMREGLFFEKLELLRHSFEIYVTEGIKSTIEAGPPEFNLLWQHPQEVRGFERRSWPADAGMSDF